MRPILTRPRLISILDHFYSLRIAVAGDFALDSYWHVDMTRSQISRETPLYNRPIVTEKYSPGGAANVAWNLADLGLAKVHAITVFGDDWRGSILHGIFDRLHINQSGILTQPGWRTPFYGKVILHGLQSQQEDARLDFINDQPISEKTEQDLADTLKVLLPDLDALIIQDMIPVGVITPAVAHTLVNLAEKDSHAWFVADSRDNLHRFKHMVIKPNEIEASHLLFPGRDPGDTTLEQLGLAMYQWSGAEGKPTYITTGKKGCLVCTTPTAAAIPALPVAPPLDTVGAGDTFCAALTAALAGGADALEAGFIANLASAVTIRKLGVTGTASTQEILAVYDAHYSN